MARTKVNEEEKEGAVGAKRVRKVELIATNDALFKKKARVTAVAKRPPKAEAVDEEEPAADAEAEEEEAKASEPVAAATEEKAEAGAAEAADEEKAKRRHRPGGAAKVRVRRERNRVTPLLALASTARVVRNVAHRITPQVMFQASALTHLRAVAEGVALRVLYEAGMLMRGSKKKRLTDEHVAMAAALRFQQAPGHTNAAYAQLRHAGYEHFDLASAMNFDYAERKVVKKRKPKEPKAEVAAAADEEPAAAEAAADDA